MRLAIWNTNYFRRFGGAEKAVHNLANRFTELGIETFLIANNTNGNQGSNQFFEPLNTKVKIYQNTFTNPWDNLNNPFLFVSKFIQYLKAALHFFYFLRQNKIPLIHLHYVSWDILLLAFYKYIFRYRLVVTFRAGEEEIARHIRLSKLKIRIALKSADRVTAVSRELCEKLEASYSFPEALYISNGVDISEIQDTAKSCAGVREDNFVFCGRLSAQKRVHFLIEAFYECIKRGCEQDLYLVGDGQEMNSIKQLISSYGIQNRVFALGALSHAQALGIIRQSRSLLLTSVFEGGPQVVLEAMAFGKPVIASDVGGLKDLVFHGENGYLYPVDRQDIFCDLIMQVSKNRAKAVALGSRGFEILAAQYDLRGTVKKYLELYRSIGVHDDSVVIPCPSDQNAKHLQKDEHFV